MSITKHYLYIGGIHTDRNSLKLGFEIPISEIRQQLEYAQTIGNDLFGLFSGVEKPVSAQAVAAAMPTVGTKLSMLLDFIFQAKSWCEVLDKMAAACRSEAETNGDEEEK